MYKKKKEYEKQPNRSTGIGISEICQYCIAIGKKVGIGTSLKFCTRINAWEGHCN